MNIAIIAAALSFAAQTRAANVVYDHPALKVKLTVHTIAGVARPDAVSYEGPKGFYLIKQSDLSALRSYDGWAAWVYDVYVLDPESLYESRASYKPPTVTRYDDDASVAIIEGLLPALRNKGKQQAPDEFAARVASLRRKVSHARGTFQSMMTMVQSYGGMVKDPAVVAAQDVVIASAEEKIAETSALRVTGEADAARAPATASNPNPKADFYWQQSLKLDSASDAVFSAQYALDLQPIPNY